jgi:hypothetical protein
MLCLLAWVLKRKKKILEGVKLLSWEYTLQQTMSSVPDQQRIKCPWIRNVSVDPRTEGHINNRVAYLGPEGWQIPTVTLSLSGLLFLLPSKRQHSFIANFS